MPTPESVTMLRHARSSPELTIAERAENLRKTLEVIPLGSEVAPVSDGSKVMVPPLPLAWATASRNEVRPSEGVVSSAAVLTTMGVPRRIKNCNCGWNFC
jgi:hypothetical protein